MRYRLVGGREALELEIAAAAVPEKRAEFALVTPMLASIAPLPEPRVLGHLRDRPPLLVALGLQEAS